MTAAEMMAHLRNKILRDAAEPVLWESSELALYFTEAEKIFARRTHCLVDDDTSLSLLSAEAGKHTYTLDKKIIHVYEITGEDGRQLRSRSRNQLPRVFSEGTPYAFTTGRGSNTVKLAPTPEEDEELSMLIARLPMKSFTDGQYTPEIPEEYHLSLCDYAAYKALVNNDPEGSNTESAANFLTQWRDTLVEAKREFFRMRTPERATVRNNWTAARRHH